MQNAVAIVALLSVLVFCCYSVQPCNGMLKIILDFDRWELAGGKDIVSMESIRVRKYNRTVSVLNGTGTLLIDLDDKYEYGFSFAPSALGNNQFNAYPMKIPSRPICQFLSTYYREYQHMFLKYTNLPSVPEEGLCPFPKGTYWAKDAYVDSSVVPQAVPEGFWRVRPELRLVETGEAVATGSFYFRITKEWY